MKSKYVWKEEAKTLFYLILLGIVYQMVSGMSAAPQIPRVYRLDFMFIAIIGGVLGSVLHLLFYRKRSHFEYIVFHPLMGSLFALLFYCLLQDFYQILYKHVPALILPVIGITCLFAGLFTNPLLQWFTKIVKELLSIVKKK